MAAHHRRLAHWLVAVLLLVAASTAAAQKVKEQNSSQENERKEKPSRSTAGPDLERAKQLIVNLTNQFRRQHDRGELHIHSKLNDAAQYYADYLAKTDEFSHTADGKEPWERGTKFGYSYSVFAENIAWEFDSEGFTTRGLAEKFLEGWKKSPPHRKNLLDPDVTDIGVGVARSKKTGRYYAVQDFGRPKSKSITFRISNDTGEAVRYRVDNKEFTLQPSYTVTMQRGRPPKVTFETKALEGKVFHPGKGDHYVLRQGSGGRLEVDEE
jgi:uncharacterized protein YkwD